MYIYTYIGITSAPIDCIYAAIVRLYALYVCIMYISKSEQDGFEKKANKKI